MAAGLDFGALGREHTRAAVAAFVRDARNHPTMYPDRATQRGRLRRTVAYCSVVVAVGVATASLIVLSTNPPRVPGAAAGGWVAIAVIAVVCALLLRSITRRQIVAPWLRWLTMANFATANGMLFAGEAPRFVLPGLIFRVGKERMTHEVFMAPGDSRFVYGNHRYVGTDIVARSRADWGFVSIKLERHVPNLVLQARRPVIGEKQALPALFARDQVLSLEGDFDRYFTLYAPREYARDALYVLTPDLMARLIDHASPFDLEVVDDQLFIYSPVAFDLASPATHGMIARLVDIVGSKARTQTARYTDTRSPGPAPASVAPGGRRLIQRSAVAFSVIGVLGVIFLQIFLRYGH